MKGEDDDAMLSVPIPGLPPLRIGLLSDKATASTYLIEFAQWARSQPGIVLEDLIICSPLKVKPVSSLLGNSVEATSRISRWMFCAIERMERKIIRRDPRHSNHLKKFDLSSVVKNIAVLTPVISDGDGCRFNPEDLRKIRERNLHILVAEGDYKLRGEILAVAELGIITLQIGDDRTNRNDPPAFWEVYFKQDTTGFSIRRLTTDGRDKILLRGEFATRHYYLLNEAFVLRKASYYLKLIVKKLSVARTWPNAQPGFPYARKALAPTAASMSKYAVQRLCSIFVKRLRRLNGLEYRMGVAFTRSNWRDAELQKANKLSNPPYRYLADPFLIRRNGKDYCFVEDFDYVKRRGSIAAYELEGTNGVRIGTVLEEDFHLSFPFLFEFGGQLYMCPETSEKGEIRIYECVDFPTRWALKKVVMKDVRAADTMIFPKDGKWWMLTNIDPSESGDFCSELFVFSASSPLDDIWAPHPSNPIVIDASRARNAGLIMEDGRYFRCAQGQAFDFYGKRLLINEITELTELRYAEACQTIVTPAFADGVVGTHHFHSVGDLTIFDFTTSSRIATGHD